MDKQKIKADKQGTAFLARIEEVDLEEEQYMQLQERLEEACGARGVTLL